MKLPQVKLDVVGTLGEKWWLVDIFPVYKYEDDQKTDVIIGYRYMIVLPERGLERIGVKVEGKRRMENPKNYVAVEFDELELYFYWQNGQPQVGARAKDIHPVIEVVE